ncbi:hypothetical protein GCM10007981_01790 [Thermocladium modestius]|uniref:NAD-dependent epimerase/dehydratase domain-containing protein n=1 Tax=Thermocladium modestius TaxID=62609 RepID=A0A830GTK1_9CREN|nr:NAD-dependent epimerase/dehydratase family protein [Thermocladium modestius]GGP19174.1 hypothetical protein GCM10007981_01790 [Thermocladium modestius]
MRTLIFGLGFIATHIAIKLSESSDVTVTYRSLTPVKKVYASILEGRARLIKVDPVKDELVDLVSSADAVVNAVGALSGNLRMAHVDVPRSIASAMAKAGSGGTLIHISASNALGPRGSLVREEERHCEGARPSNEFEETKCEGERVVFEEAGRGGYPFAVLRPTLVYGRYAAHSEWGLMYRAAKVGFIPKIGVRVSAVSAVDLAAAVDALIRAKPRGLYMYLTECEPVPVESFISIMAAALGSRRIAVPMPARLAMLALPGSVRRLAKYAGVRYDCSSTRRLLGSVGFREDEVAGNALFLRRLEEAGVGLD